MTPTIKASEIQVGGDHYRRLSYQPVKLIARLGCSFCQGNIIKYISRWKDKNGIEDLNKAKHYCQLAAEFGDWRRCDNKTEVHKFIHRNGIDLEESAVLWHAVEAEFAEAIQIIDRIIDSELSVKQL